MSEPDSPLPEVWLPIKGHDGFLVSNHGRVAKSDGKLKKLTKGRCHGYLVVGLWDGQRTVVRLVHQLVCEAFHGDRPSKAHQVAHCDGGRTNNHATNLRWATSRENASDKYVHGTHRQGEDAAQAKLTNADVRAIRAIPKGRMKLEKIAAQFGVSKDSIAHIRTRSRGIWPHVPFPTEGDHA